VPRAPQAASSRAHPMLRLRPALLTPGHSCSLHSARAACTNRPPPPPIAQVFLGSLAIVVGLAAGATIHSVSGNLVLAGGYEAARLALVALFVAGHRRENIAKP
jgi:hypothetical protein